MIKFTDKHGQPTEILVSPRKDNIFGCEVTKITPNERKVINFEMDQGSFIYTLLRILRSNGINWDVIPDSY